jgi:dihydroorotate dehydrogenase electron transfer subunit
MPHNILTEVTSTTALGHGYHLLEFASPEMADLAEPAQFFMVGIPNAEILLRRPYSICGSSGTFNDRPRENVQILFKVVGRGTAMLAALKPGSQLDVLGPLGNGFKHPETAGTTPLFVAGGIGSAPFPALAHSMERLTPQPLMLYGARSAHDLPLLDWFNDHLGGVIVSTDDGSVGHHGRVTEPLETLLQAGSGIDYHIYACGPEPMLRAVAKVARRFEVTCDLALEAYMACGFGVCLGCVVPVITAGGETIFERVCMEGPVMRSDRLAW